MMYQEGAMSEGWLFVTLLSVLANQDPVPHDHEAMHRLHQDPQAYIAMLEDPARDAYQKPEAVVGALGLRPGEAVADIGSGSGYFTLRLAGPVGPEGRVYAVDVDPNMVRHLNRRLRDAGIDTVRSILAEPDDPLLADASVDRFFVCDTWHHIEDQAKYLALMKKMLRAGGEVVMIDFKKEATPMGPPLDMRIAKDQLVKQMREAGFSLSAEHAFLPYQYFLVFRVTG
jgi:ubiquinone/menaquinone biosynthesis C-methylase UbiE